MFSIGDFAQYGRVSARMLRHYDAIGLLCPARTDPVTGYRFYEAAQLARLNRIIALKDLGFSLQQVGAILAEEVSVPELRGMLRLRRAELAATLTAAGERLAQVEARLRSIESEGHMSADDVVVKPTGTVLLAELSGVAAGYGPEDIGPVIQPLYAELCAHLEAAGVTPAGPGLAYYEDVRGSAGSATGDEPGPGAVVVHAGLTVTAEALARAGARCGGTGAPATGTPTATGLGFDVVALPGLECAATVVHRGPMSRILPTAQNLAHWIDANGYRSAGYARELYLECPPDQEKWVTEIQEPVVRAAPDTP
ncbi:MerR family transcriptional regulator [Streptomyces endophytica]|uniref:MerR family transcriptional regulator n=1 Tax=Streptomyces endophytica TaxID=2991496 RepID=A0ABY6P9B5_9ACTN|nr:MerR family transcriptional regulator [Streptomyces endophytica]UZJ30394.1 MerR family transcriptional regulator [Streptomyces endophytica]